MTQTFTHPFAISVDKSRTNEFKEICVKLTADPISNKLPANQSINQSAKISQFTQAAILLRQGIKQIEELIESQRKPYLNIHRHLSNQSVNQSIGQMTESDRDNLESTVASFVLEYKAKIEDLVSSIQDDELKNQSINQSDDDDQSINQSVNQPINKHLIEHQHAICQSLFNQLKQITQSIHSMKQFRINQLREEMEANKTRTFTAKYSAPKKSINQSTNQSANQSVSQSTSQSTSQSNERSRSSSLDQSFSQIHNEEHTNRSTSQSTNQSINHLTDQSIDQSINQSVNQSDPESDPIQAQLLQENASLLQSFSTDLSAIHHAESQARDIANMLTLFHEKVFEQSELIDRIDSQTIESTSMIENGIEQLRRAANRGASFRMMILFVIVVLSFSLLFLDWYST